MCFFDLKRFVWILLISNVYMFRKQHSPYYHHMFFQLLNAYFIHLKFFLTFFLIQLCFSKNSTQNGDLAEHRFLEKCLQKCLTLKSRKRKNS